MKLTIGDNIPVTADAVLVGKLGTYQIEIRQPKWLAQLNRFSQAGGAVIADYTDHHIAIRSKQSSFYRELLEIAHLLITPSESMKAQLSANLDTLVHVIEDRLEFGGLPPKDPENYSNTVLWFGHESNLIFLSNLVLEWPDSLSDKTVLIVSGKGGDALLKHHLDGKKVKINLQYLEWSITTLMLAARRADVAVIPSDGGSYKQYASNNRLVSSLTLGLPTVATPLPSYREFKDCFADLSRPEGEATLSRPDLGVSGVRLFQKHYMQRFSEQAIVESWQKAFSEHLATP